MKLKHTLEGRAASIGSASGLARLIRTPEETSSVTEAHILVVEMTTPDYVMAMRVAAGIIATKGGATCHAAVVAREMNKPCIVAAADALDLIDEGDHVTMDGGSGQIRVFTPEPEDGAPAEPTPSPPTQTPFYYRRVGG